MKELDLEWQDVEVNPFEEPKPRELMEVNPEGLVPVLIEGERVITGTRKITGHLAGEGHLVPGDPKDRARMEEVIGLMDAQGYWPMVRMVYAKGVFAPFLNEPMDQGALREGLARAEPVCDRLEACLERGYLAGERQSLADHHAAPMVHALGRHPEGARMIETREKLAAWLKHQQDREAFRATRPPEPA